MSINNATKKNYIRSLDEREEELEKVIARYLKGEITRENYLEEVTKFKQRIDLRKLASMISR